MNFKKTCIALALAGGFVSVANAAPTVISLGGTSATIADSGLFSSSTALGLNHTGLEYVNHGTWSSNYTLRDSGGIIATADQVFGTNPFAAIPFGATASAVTTSGSFGGWGYLSTATTTAPGHLVYAVTITNNTGADVSGALWGFGIGLDQGIPGTSSYSTTNVINGVGLFSSVSATSSDGHFVTLKDIAADGTQLVQPYVNWFCCSPVDPLAMYTAAQPVGNYGFNDHSINLAFTLGNSGVLHDGESTVLSYEIITGVPEPETYAMFMAGLGLMGFIARRRKNGQA